MKICSYAVKTFFLSACCATLLAPPARGADWKFSSSFNYDSGDYGTGTRTESVYIPFTIKRYYREGDLSVTVPFLRQSSTGQVTRVGGRPMLATGGKTGAAASSETGLGDIMVRGAYILRQDGPGSFDLAAAGRLKLPTADETRGLGTGELDEGVGFEFAKRVSPGLTLLADGYYTIIGDPEGVDFNNQLALDIGFSRPLNGKTALTVLYETRGALLDGNSDPRELSGTLEYKSADGNNYSGGLLLGLSDGSPELGLSFGLSRRF